MATTKEEKVKAEVLAAMAAEFDNSKRVFLEAFERLSVDEVNLAHTLLVVLREVSDQSLRSLSLTRVGKEGSGISNQFVSDSSASSAFELSGRLFDSAGQIIQQVRAGAVIGAFREMVEGASENADDHRGHGCGMDPEKEGELN